MFDRIRLRLTLGYVGILALILAAFGSVLVAGFRGATVSQHDDVLVRQAGTLSDTLARGDAVDTRSMNGSDEYAWAHLAPDGRVLDRDTTARDLGLPSTEAARRSAREGEPVLLTVDLASRSAEDAVRVASAPVVRSGRVVGTVQVGRSLQTDLEAVNRLVLVLVPLGLASLVLAGLGGLLMSRRAVRPALEAFERQRAFVADASHELKTPLSLARIDGEVLLRDPTATDAGEILEHQLSEIDRTGAILADLLVLARLDSGQLNVERKPFDLAPLLFETAARFNTRALAAGVTLDVSVPGKLPVRGDEVCTGQILAALLDNALRYTMPGGSITITGRSLDGRVEASVTDTGPGIPTEHLPRVFDRFYRAEEARTRKGGGTGLGLAIARDLARAQGGELSAGNAPGNKADGKADAGAAFRFSLPGNLTSMRA